MIREDIETNAHLRELIKERDERIAELEKQVESLSEIVKLGCGQVDPLAKLTNELGQSNSE